MKVVIDNLTCEAEYGEYILTAARRNGIDIPAMCHSYALPEMGACRLCIVELVEGENSKVVASCLYPITKELVIRTESYRIVRMRKIIMKLLLSRSPENEYLNSFARKYGLFPSKLRSPEVESNDCCILCGLCVKACEQVGAYAISAVGRGISKKIAAPYEEPSASCVGCGSCAAVCPTGAIKMEDKNSVRTIWGKAVELVSCKKCGQYYAPRGYIEFLEKRLGEELDGEYCSSCMKAIYAEKFRNIYET